MIPVITSESKASDREVSEVQDRSSTDVPGGKYGIVFTIILAAFSAAHLYIALYPELSELERNGLHFGGFSAIAAFVYPFTTRLYARTGFFKTLDIIFGLLILLSAAHLVFSESEIYARGVNLDKLDWLASFVCIFGAIELTRRLTGWLIPGLIVFSLSYIALWGQYVPGMFAFPGLSLETLVFRSIYGDDALFGTIARISSTYVFLFVLFGAFLMKSGGGEFVINLARLVAGRLVGGPGLVAVMASALTGTISGSAVANTASTGVITIPLMKRAGFESKFAGGVEAAASTGGQLMPPIMGAGAFVMSGYTQISYEYIVTVAVLPALLYFLSVAFFVRIEAKRTGLKPAPSEGMTLKDALAAGGVSFLLPLTLVIVLLVLGFTPTYSAVFGTFAVIVSSWFARNPMTPRVILEALALGARTMVLTAVLLCSVGLVVNVIATAGIGNTFSLMIAEWSGGYLLVAMLLVALASLVLGMGLPVTAAYIVLATLSAPALAGLIADQALIEVLVRGDLPQIAMPLVQMFDPEFAIRAAQSLTHTEASEWVSNLPMEAALPLRELAVSPEATMVALLSAHMIIFWLSQDSNVTPPVALASFTAAAIARAPAMGTGFESWKLAKGLYIVPVLFAFTPILSGNWSEMLLVFGFAVFGIYGLAAAIQGCMENPLNSIGRVIAFFAGIACLWPQQLIVQIPGMFVVAGVFWYSTRKDLSAREYPSVD